MHRSQLENVELAWWEWNPELRGKAPTLLLAHASGFSARVFDPMIGALPDLHAVAFDLHGHGASSGQPVEHWSVFAGEICELTDQIDLSGAIGVGHSLGGHTLLRCSAAKPELFSQLVLFDPVVMSPDFYARGEGHFDNSKPHPASRRRAHFESVDAFRQRYADRDPYQHFAEGAFENFCRFALKPAPDGDGVVLACHQDMEASVYMSGGVSGDVLELARSVVIPTLVVRARQSEEYDFLSSPTWAGLADHLPQGQDMLRGDMTHFHPLEDPSDAARIVAQFAGLDHSIS